MEYLNMPYFICTTLFLLYINSVICQNAFHVSVTITPNNDMTPGVPVNMTCTFERTKDMFLNLNWGPTDGSVIAHYNGRYTDRRNLGITNDGFFLSTNANAMSFHWIKFQGFLCDESSRSGEYDCHVTDTALHTGSGKAYLKYRDPVHEIMVNNNPASGEWTLENTEIGKPQTFSFSTEEQRDAVVAMTMKIDDEDVPDTTFTNSSDTIHCSHSASMKKDVTFDSSGDHTITFEVNNNNALTYSLTVTVKACGTCAACLSVYKLMASLLLFHHVVWLAVHT